MEPVPEIFPMHFRLFRFRNGIFLLHISRITTAFTRHCAPFRNIVSLPATQGPATEVPAGRRPPVVDITTPLFDSAAVRLLLVQVLAWCIYKEKSIRFFETPFTEVEQLVGFALPDKDNRKPAAALSASAARSRFRGGLGGFHTIITIEGNSGKMVRCIQITMPFNYKVLLQFPTCGRMIQLPVTGNHTLRYTDA
jgi:hypothetical protein